MSECRDIPLAISCAQHEWAQEINTKKVLSLHISSVSKLNEGIPDMFIGDLIEILHYIDADLINKLGREEEEMYSYVKMHSCTFKSIESICGTR